MEKYTMIDVWRLKLNELYLQEELMKKDSKFTKEDLTDLKIIINYVKNELKKEIYKEKISNAKRV